jgi:hypothetical protein
LAFGPGISTYCAAYTRPPSGGLFVCGRQLTQRKDPAWAASPRGRRDYSWRLHALRNDLELLVIRPAPPPTGFYNAETFNLSTELIAVHKDCYTALNLTRQGAPRRRKTYTATIGANHRCCSGSPEA